MSRKFLARALAASAVALVSSQATFATAALKILDAYPGGSVFVHGIDAWTPTGGRIVGSAVDPATGIEHAALWVDGVYQDLGSLGGTAGWANFVNSAYVVGASEDSSGNPQPVVFRDGQPLRLGTLHGARGGEARGGGRFGTVGWSYADSSDTQHAMSWGSAGVFDLGPGVATTADDFGHAAGYLYDGSGRPHAVMWNADRSKVFLDDAGAEASNAVWMSEGLASPIVAGSEDIAGSRHAVEWSGGVAKRLQELGAGGESAAMFVGVYGGVVGWSMTNGYWGQHAAYWDAAGAVHDLNDWLSPQEASQWLLVSANGMDRGGFAGEAVNRLTGAQAGFYLPNPIPEPSTWALLAGGLVVMLGHRARRAWALPRSTSD